MAGEKNIPPSMPSCHTEKENAKLAKSEEVN